MKLIYFGLDIKHHKQCGTPGHRDSEIYTTIRHN